MSKNDNPRTERRRFPRVMAPVFYRAPKIFTRKKKVTNISLAGVRIYSDEQLKEGEQLELEFFLPDGASLTAVGRVVWINELPPDYEALYDVGLEFTSFSEEAVDRLKSVLKIQSKS